jgi:hypothetical protein
MASLVSLSDYRRKQKPVFFSRPELNQILALYSRQVARGEWRDYAIDQREGAALFSIFRHTHESALFTIVKTTASRNRAGGFILLAGRQRVATGKALSDVLASLRKQLTWSARTLDDGGRR